jgi:hypothetical protein
MFFTALIDKGQMRKLEQEKDIQGNAEYNITYCRARTKATKHEHMKWSPTIQKTEIHKNHHFLTNGTGTR